MMTAFWPWAATNRCGATETVSKDNCACAGGRHSRRRKRLSRSLKQLFFTWTGLFAGGKTAEPALSLEDPRPTERDENRSTYLAEAREGAPAFPGSLGSAPIGTNLGAGRNPRSLHFAALRGRLAVSIGQPCYERKSIGHYPKSPPPGSK